MGVYTELFTVPGQMQHGIRIYSTHDYQIALSLLPAIFFVSMILSFFLPSSSKQKT